MRILVFIFLGFVQLHAVGFASESEWQAEWDKSLMKAKDLFTSRDWEGLEKFANEARDEKTMVGMGFPVLEAVYAGLYAGEHLEKSEEDDKWTAWYKVLDDWDEEIPDSKTVPAVKISFWTAFAWKARGGGLANTVKQEGWKLFRERLEKAEEIFESKGIDAKGEPFACPGFYSAATNISLGQGWPKKRIDEEIIEPVIKLYPYYFEVFVRRATSLLPRRGGADGGDYKFFATLPDRIGGEQGPEIYAQVLLRAKINEIFDYRPDLVDWETMKRGMVGLNVRYPDSTFLTERCVTFAHRYAEQLELLEMIEESGSKAADRFYKSSPYGKAFELQKTDQPSCLRLIKYFKPKGVLGADSIIGLAAAKGEKSFVATFGYRGVGEYNLESGEGEIIIPPRRRAEKYVAKSADDKWMVFSTSKSDELMGQTDVLLEVRSIDQGWPVEVSYNMEKGSISYPIFSKDSKSIIFGYIPAKRQKAKNGIYLWDWQTAGAIPRKIRSFGSKTIIRLIYDEPSGNLYALRAGKLVSCDLKNPKEPVTEILDPKEFKRILVWDYLLVDGGKHLLVLGGKQKRGKNIYLVNRETGKVITQVSLGETGNDARRIAYTKSKKLKKDIIVSSGFSGSMSTWILNKEAGGFSIQRQATFPLNGQHTYVLHSITTEEGANYVVQGTKNGMLGIYEVE